MATKILAILAILIGIGSFVVGHIEVQKRIDTIIEEREANLAKWQQETSAKRQVQTELANTQQTLSSTQAELAQTQSDLSNTRQQLSQKTSEASDLNQRLSRANREIADLKQEYSDFLALNKKTAEIRKALKDLVDTTKERDGLIAENKQFTLQINKLNNRITSLTKDLTVPVLGHKVEGQVTAVDPKYQYVIIDLGDEDGLKVNTELMVNRNGELMGKLKVTRVETKYSVANIMQSWLAEGKAMIEGDAVLN